MLIQDAIKAVKTSLVWGSWDENQSNALRTLLLEAEKVKLLTEENAELRKRLSS